MNIVNMRGYFQIASLAKPFLPPPRAGMRQILACLSGMVLPAPVFALVGPAREAPEFAPYVVTVLDKSGGGASFCTAIVIAPNVVLTAAHCVSNLSDTRVFYRDGHSQLVFVDIASIAVHPEFRPKIGRKHLISIDLALLRLAEPLPPGFKPIELADSCPVATGQPFRIAGFGRAEESVSGTSGVLRAGILVASGPRSPFLVWLTDPDGTGLGGCTGDSGAPVLAVGQPALVAVAIRANGINGYSCGAS
ncbi:MAG TPA: S1 family peptidase, partial [Methylocella sp.]|nr:S1 family peptidase [Methylocella sp.]